MFDWNDEELANIIWDEAGEGDDHIVPYPEGNNRNKKEPNQQGAATKRTGQKTLVTEDGFSDAKLESSSNFDKDGRIASSEVSMDSWPDLSSSNFIKDDQEALTAEVSNDVSETAKYDSSKGETAQSDRNNQIFENPQEAEQNDFVDYGWESIGSFDDLDRIFSNDEPLFGHVLGNADELWCSKDVTNSSIKSFSISGDSPKLGSEALTDASEILQVKAENAQEDDGSLNLVYGKSDDPPSLHFQHGSAPLELAEHGRDQIKHDMKEQSNFPVAGASTATTHLAADNILTPNEYSDKVPRQKKHHKGQKKQEGKNEGRISRDLYGAWSSAGNSSGQYEHHPQLAPSVMHACAPPAMSQLRNIPGLDSFHYQHIHNPYLYPHAFGNVPNPFPASPSVSHSLQSGKLKGQAMVSGFEVSPVEVNPINKRVDSSDKPPTMTPREKIEKLRRRQQMQAMLAIQRQQEQFNNQAASYSMSQKGPVENQIQHVSGADFGIDDMSTLPSVDTNSAVEQDDSNTISVAVADSAAEDIVLHRLQDVIAKLDSKIRLCIRDSLFRLAKSAVQRHYTSDTSSTNTCSKDESEGLSKEDNNADTRHVRMPDVETETNPIDRAVAHLLFHRPLESSAKHPGTPDSPRLTKLPGESKTSDASNLFKRSQAEQGGFHQGPKSPKDSQQIYLIKSSSPCLDTSENASSGVPMEFEASQ
ncbi:protein LNK2 [Punica granatum]|uniref:Uncharacterized protein n=2 Tax=Punica granatum TaxID=22663 RepID=A0A2I0K4D9_PUNGR|nr:protein LNK2 [Punica granatum]PKI63010.1 hypothetical protein CRG98_016649 [Punica granatum]